MSGPVRIRRVGDDVIFETVNRDGEVVSQTRMAPHAAIGIGREIMNCGADIIIGEPNGEIVGRGCE